MYILDPLEGVTILNLWYVGGGGVEIGRHVFNMSLADCSFNPSATSLPKHAKNLNSCGRRQILACIEVPFIVP